jgi:hypothetical protein
MKGMSSSRFFTYAPTTSNISICFCYVFLFYGKFSFISKSSNKWIESSMSRLKFGSNKLDLKENLFIKRDKHVKTQLNPKKFTYPSWHTLHQYSIVIFDAQFVCLWS